MSKSILSLSAPRARTPRPKMNGPCDRRDPGLMGAGTGPHHRARASRMTGGSRKSSAEQLSSPQAPRGGRELSGVEPDGNGRLAVTHGVSALCEEIHRARTGPFAANEEAFCRVCPSFSSTPGRGIGTRRLPQRWSGGFAWRSCAAATRSRCPARMAPREYGVGIST